jgi:hypothetical protein
MASAAQLHREQLALFKQEVRKLRPLLAEAADGEVRFGGTIVAHSAKAVAMLAPIEPPSLRDYNPDGKLVAVLWLTPGSQQTGVERRVPAGVFALRLRRVGSAGARAEFVAPDGKVAHVARGIPRLLDVKDVWDRIRKILKQLGLEVNIEILFGGGKDEPSKVRASLVFWSFDLFDDP